MEPEPKFQAPAIQNCLDSGSTALLVSLAENRQPCGAEACWKTTLRQKHSIKGRNNLFYRNRCHLFFFDRPLLSSPPVWFWWHDGFPWYFSHFVLSTTGIKGDRGQVTSIRHGFRRSGMRPPPRNALTDARRRWTSRKIFGDRPESRNLTNSTTTAAVTHYMSRRFVKINTLLFRPRRCAGAGSRALPQHRSIK